ncbi:MAG: pyruvate, phosphate dikinase [Geobacteraceae bacterium]|nr:pyruvate, phosphate dikinase [Geobacteraceae bacterium]
MAAKYVYFFGNGSADGATEMKALLGGKGANLAEMTSIGLPVPPGFTITTEVCTEFYKNNNTYPPSLKDEVNTNIRKVEELLGKQFGSPDNPLLLSVRSGARASMPGMMDTVLNLGLNDVTVQGIIKQSGDERFAYDAYRRFVQMYSNVVMGMKGFVLEELLEQKKEEKSAHLDTELTAEDWKDLVGKYKAKIKEVLGCEFPDDPQEQIWGAVTAVFGSWMNQRAITYRKLHNIPAEWGTAVNIQAMVFGNMGNDCATGVAFTRDPSTGENYFYGEYLENAQGEDVVAGIRTPQPINRTKHKPGDLPSMEEVLPECYQQLVKIRDILEKHYKDMQDIEFTIEKGKLFMLQTRNGKRTSLASIKIAVDMVKEGLIDEKTAVLRVSPDQLDKLLHPSLDPKAPRKVIAKGLPASPGAASGSVVFTADEAEAAAKLGLKVILVRVETSPEDIHGMNAAQGILTARGGMTSHAAVVARGMGKCCVAGCGEISVDYAANEFSVDDTTVSKGDIITLDGSTGEVMLGQVSTVPPQLTGDFKTIMEWVDTYRKLGVRANADTPKDARTAREFGAEGIGLTRTEHMFFEADRIAAVREMILADDVEGRKKALAKILPMQKGDFIGIFREMKGLPVTIRLLDPPLHEFLPQEEKDIEALSQTMGVSVEKLKHKVEYLHEFNPMLGHRGCRLGVTFPEIYDMQVQAIMEAACELNKNEGFTIVPEIMIPLVAVLEELASLRANAVRICDEVMEQYGVKVKYLIGTMIELPRAALVADEIARDAEFFSFGTNDLTQTTFGLSRDDAGKFLPFYVEKGILKEDPFVSIDQNGVGQLVKIGCEKGRSTRKDLKIGICGEHGGDPASVIFCHKVGLDYVSCSPFRVPIARLAAAHAALQEEQGTDQTDRTA